MAFAINFMFTSQPIRGDALPMEGTAVADHATSSPQTVPEGCNYITVSTDAAATISINDGENAYVSAGYQNKTYRKVNAGEVSFPVIKGAVITVV